MWHILFAKGRLSFKNPTNVRSTNSCMEEKKMENVFRSITNPLQNCITCCLCKAEYIHLEFYRRLWGYRRGKRFIQFSLVYCEEQGALCLLDDNMRWRAVVQKSSSAEFGSLNSATEKMKLGYFPGFLYWHMKHKNVAESQSGGKETFPLTISSWGRFGLFGKASKGRIVCIFLIFKCA